MLLWTWQLCRDTSCQPIRAVQREGGRQLTRATDAWLARGLLVQHRAGMRLPGSVRGPELLVAPPAILTLARAGNRVWGGCSGLAMSGRVWMQEDEALMGCAGAKYSWLNLPPPASC